MPRMIWSVRNDCHSDVRGGLGALVVVGMAGMAMEGTAAAMRYTFRAGSWGASFAAGCGSTGCGRTAIIENGARAGKAGTSNRGAKAPANGSTERLNKTATQI